MAEGTAQKPGSWLRPRQRCQNPANQLKPLADLISQFGEPVLRDRPLSSAGRSASSLPGPYPRRQRRGTCSFPLSMDSDPPPRSPQLSQRRSSVDAFSPAPSSDDRWASQRLLEQSPMPQQGRDEAEVSQAAHSADPEDRLPGDGGGQAASSPGPAGEGSGLGLAAPLIGALIGLLTLVLPMVVVLDDRPGHPLAKPLSSRQSPLQGPAMGPTTGPALAAPGAPSLGPAFP